MRGIVDVQQLTVRVRCQRVASDNSREDRPSHFTQSIGRTTWESYSRAKLDDLIRCKYHLQSAWSERLTDGIDRNSSGGNSGDVRTLCKAGRLKDALHILNQQGIQADSNMYVCVLQECINTKGLAEGKQVHAHIIQRGFQPNVFLFNTLVNMYAKCGSVVNARQVFDRMPERDMATFNIMIAGYTKHGCGSEALRIFEQMQLEGLKPNRVSFICVLNACASLGTLEKGKDIHAGIITAGVVPDIFLETALVDMYAKCGSVKHARKVFNNMGKRNVVSWSAMIGGYAQHGCGREAVEIYEQMQQEGETPNGVTFTCILRACAGLGALEKGKEVHTDIRESGISPDIILQNTLVDMYAKCGSMKDARQVFDNMVKKDVVSWSAMIAGYAQQGCGREALDIYEQMIRKRVMPNKVTFISVLNGCAILAALEKGKEVHADIIKAGIVQDIVLETALIDMYAKCGSIKDARQLFDKMGHRDVVSWSAMIAGYAQQGCGREAFDIYEQMVQESVMPNKVTFISVLNACASLAALEKGREIHCHIIQAGIARDIILETALVDMYSKCGSMRNAWQVFDNMANRDVASWNAMIVGYAQHGCSGEVLQQFELMQQEGLKPDTITFTALLTACSHVGLVDEGRHYFNSISQDHGLTPTFEHFGCMVDLLGRAGQLDEAKDFINSMPTEPDGSVWGALLGACRIHGDVELAELAAKSLLKWDPEDAATYVLLSNIYGAAGRWDDKAKVRRVMEDRGV